MRIATTCMECLPEQDALERGEVLYADLEEERILIATCVKGHENRFVLQQTKFELLMEMGGLALLDGYYREAVASFAAALERFYEFYVRVVAEARAVNQADLETAWKHMSRQSERQLGGFILLHLLEAGATPQLPGKMVELRNDVIHKGLFPPKSAAYTYGKWAFEFIVSTALPLREKHAEAANTTIVRMMSASLTKLREKPGAVGTQYTSMFLSWADSTWASATFEASMRNLAGRRHYTWAPPVPDTDVATQDEV